MKITDIVRLSQTNLVRAKLRTFLTILAVFIGTFTISTTTGVGNGVKAYINKELGNVGVDNAFVVQVKTPSQNGPISSDVVKYDPNTQKSGNFENYVLTSADIATLQTVKNVQKVTPNYTSQVDYITNGIDKYVASTSQFIPGLNLDLAAGRVVNINNPNEITIPIRYVGPLGFGSANGAIGKSVALGYKNSKAIKTEKIVSIVGVQQASILGSSQAYITPTLAKEIQTEQTYGNPVLANTYPAALVEFDSNLSQAQRDELKATLEANKYTAQTIQDQIGTFSKIINGILVGLDVFGAIALIAASFGIINTLLMAVNERTSEIGLMKALGANSRTIFGLFSIEAASIGFWGAILGIGVSMGAGAILNKYASTHFLRDFAGFNLLSFPIPSVLIILGGIVLLAFLAGALPSIKASRLDPIKALRYE